MNAEHGAPAGGPAAAATPDGPQRPLSRGVGRQHGGRPGPLMKMASWGPNLRAMNHRLPLPPRSRGKGDEGAMPGMPPSPGPPRAPAPAEPLLSEQRGPGGEGGTPGTLHLG